MRIQLFSISVILFFFFLPQAVFSQKCNCPEELIYKAEQEAADNDSKPYIEKLLASKNVICQGKGYEWLAMEYMENKSFDTSELYFSKAEKIYQTSHCGDSIFMTTYKFWAGLYYTMGDFAKSQDYSFKFLHAAEQANNPYEIGGCYTMIAQLFNQMEQAEKGIVYAQKAVRYLDLITDVSKKADLYFKLSKRYLWHYQDTKVESSLDSSEYFSLQHLKIAKAINKYSSIAAAFSNLEGIAYERNDFRKALQLLDSSFRYTESSNYSTLAVNYFDKADLLIEVKDYNEAARMADSALFYYQQSGSVAYIAGVYELQSRIQQEKGDYKKAFEWSQLGRVITDSIRNVDKMKEVAELEKKYNQAKNEKTILQLAQQKRIYLLLAVAGLLSLIVVGFFIRQQSLKNKQKILETEQRLNRARMNPHFFFNALSSLQSFALQENDGKALASNLSRFSHIMRETLESTYKEYVTIEQEIDFLNEYIELQKIRFPQKFSYNISVARDIEIDELNIPSMILQPFVENSIEHGFSGLSYPGHIQLDFSIAATDLCVVIADNGKGFSTVGKSSDEHVSRASQIIKDRIYLLNIKLKTRARFHFENHPSGQGVVVKIYLPLLTKGDIS